MIKHIHSLRDTGAIFVTRPLRLPQTGSLEFSPDDPAFFCIAGIRDGPRSFAAAGDSCGEALTRQEKHGTTPLWSCITELSIHEFDAEVVSMRAA